MKAHHITVTLVFVYAQAHKNRSTHPDICECSYVSSDQLERNDLYYDDVTEAFSV